MIQAESFSAVVLEGKVLIPQITESLVGPVVLQGSALVLYTTEV